jgi:hypothetical protein
MLENSKLSLVLESLMTRYRIGSFLVGDQIKLLDSITKADAFAKLPVEVTDQLKDILDAQKTGDVILKITSINSRPWLQGTPEAQPLSFEIGTALGGGQFSNTLILPGELINQIERISNDINLPEEIPAGHKITYTNEPEVVTLATVEDEEGYEENIFPKKQRANHMPTSDNKIGNKKAPTEVDYKKGIKSTMDANGGELDTDFKA